MSQNLIATGIALIPIIWLFISLGFIRMPAHKACPAGLAISLAIAVMFWQMPWPLALEAALEGSVLALLPILWVILAAFFTFNISLKTGAMDRIKNLLASLSGDRRIQALIIAWGFGGFLEATAGFGTAVAIPASILIALGFKPLFSAIICLLANTVAVAFGVVGIPATTLAKITELPVIPLSVDIALQLTFFVILLPFVIILTITKSISGLKGVWLTTFIAGLSYAGAQLAVAKFVGPELAAIISSIISFGATAFIAKISPPAEEWRFSYEDGRQTDGLGPVMTGRLKDQLIAWAPYLFLLFLVLGTSKMVPAVHETLGNARSEIPIYTGPGGKPLIVDWVLTPGTLIIISAIAGGIIQGASLRSFIEIFGATVRQLEKTVITVIAIVSMAKILAYSGMVSSIALFLANTTGPAYPLFAPLIGALGTFITGSDTSANVLFGALQKETALQIGSNPSWIAAANTSGACAGKMISPQSIAIATSATGLTGKEGEILKVTSKYVIAFVFGLGLITYMFAF